MCVGHLGENLLELRWLRGRAGHSFRFRLIWDNLTGAQGLHGSEQTPNQVAARHSIDK
jgi:hypothetical protein